MPTIGLGPSDMSATCIAAENQAISSQRRYLALMRAQIALPLVGVVIGAAAKFDSRLAALGVIASATAVMVAVLRAIQRSRRYDSMWYEARAAAEEVKSLAWRYAVRGAPFDRVDESTDDAEARFIAELSRIADNNDLLAPPDPSGEITDAMRALRSAPDDDTRREAYLEHRVKDQQHWYAMRARHNDAVAARWDLLFYAVIAVAVFAGAFLASNTDSSRALGPVVALAAGGSGAVVGWVAVRRYASLARSYRAVARQLSHIAALAYQKDTHEEWVAFVADVEQTIMREHAQWLAVRK